MIPFPSPPFTQTGVSGREVKEYPYLLKSWKEGGWNTGKASKELVEVNPDEWACYMSNSQLCWIDRIYYCNFFFLFAS